MGFFPKSFNLFSALKFFSGDFRPFLAFFQVLFFPEMNRIFRIFLALKFFYWSETFGLFLSNKNFLSNIFGLFSNIFQFLKFAIFRKFSTLSSSNPFPLDFSPACKTVTNHFNRNDRTFNFHRDRENLLIRLCENFYYHHRFSFLFLIVEGPKRNNKEIITLIIRNKKE